MKTIKQIWSALFKNTAALEGRFRPWYVAVILFLLSIILASVPMFTTTATSNGSDFLEGTLYSVDNGLQRFAESLNTKGVDLVVAQNGEVFTLENTTSNWETGFTLEDAASGFPYFAYTDATDAIRFKVYFQDANSNEASATFVNGLLTKANSAEAIDTSIVSFMFLGTNSIYLYVYNPAEVAAGTSAGANYTKSFKGGYSDIEVGTNLADFAVKDVFGNSFPADPTPVQYAAYQQSVLVSWKQFFDNAYLLTKNVLLWTTTGIMMGVNSLLALFMGLLVFIMTRGKNNPNHTFTFFESMKVGAWVLLAPAILSVAVGYIFPSYASMAFVLLVGLRMMWLSSKNLRPQYVQAPGTQTIVNKK